MLIKSKQTSRLHQVASGMIANDYQRIVSLVIFTLSILVGQGLAQEQPDSLSPTQTKGPAQVNTSAVPVALPKRFHLTEKQESYLDQILASWQGHTDETETFRCDFTRWNYNPAFELPQFKDVPIIVNNGDLKYANPDKGTYRITRVMNLDTKTGEYQAAKDTHGEHWVCDGESIWQRDHKTKRVIERKIPEDAQGEAISNTPLPFLFGSRAVDLKRRYFLCIVTPEEYAETEIWVDAIPRTQTDASNFREAILRLKRANFQPIALRIYDPGDTYSTYEFSNIVINDPFEGIKQLFAPPHVPFGWRKVLEMPPEATARRQEPPTENSEPQ
jgi:TIGR03009 family protein